MAGDKKRTVASGIAVPFWSAAAFLFVFLFSLISATPAHAGLEIFGISLQGTEVEVILENIINSLSELPKLLSAMAYIFGLLLAVNGILMLRSHVENPQQMPMRRPIIRLLAGGCLFALPNIYHMMQITINPGEDGQEGYGNTIFGMLSGLLGALNEFIPQLNFNNVLINIIASISEAPGFISAWAYLAGMLLGVWGIYKLKDHVENPDQTPMREAIVRFIIGGMLFALPTIYDAMATAITGGEGAQLLDQIGSVLGALNFFLSSYAEGMDAVCNPLGGFFGMSLGDQLCGIIFHTGVFPAFLAAISYLFGLVLGLWGIFKLRDHVLNPDKVPVGDPIGKLVAGGLFLVLPIIVETVRSSVTPLALSAYGSPIANLVGDLFGSGATVTGYNEVIDDACKGLDGAMACFVNDILGPIHMVMNFFAFCAGMILIMIGISRLMKSAQDGARGPSGIGTMMTFVTAGALISYNEFVRAFTMSMFSDPRTLTFAELQYTEGMSDAELIHAHTVISAIIKFMIIVGLISFVRGIFIIRALAEGSGQASLMAGVTHMVGGALAVNLGPLMNAVQATLGIEGYGIAFS
ncbi:MAG: hypothetical protein L6Q57_09200 [Alphaproteobacteria bacterium]|nr:hypothetical protein [Alphaproteobacteria bacterium]